MTRAIKLSAHAQVEKQFRQFSLKRLINNIQDFTIHVKNIITLKSRLYTILSSPL